MVKTRKEVREFVKDKKVRENKKNETGLAGISNKLDKVYNEFRAGKLSESQARTLTYILRSKALTERDRYLDEMDTRIKEIENKYNLDAQEDLIFSGWD